MVRIVAMGSVEAAFGAALEAGLEGCEMVPQIWGALPSFVRICFADDVSPYRRR